MASYQESSRSSLRSQPCSPTYLRYPILIMHHHVPPKPEVLYLIRALEIPRGRQIDRQIYPCRVVVFPSAC